MEISTHALREEGDPVFDTGQLEDLQFLPTPSARRATTAYAREPLDKRDFYPRPPRGGRLQYFKFVVDAEAISTHALREEGDGGPGVLVHLIQISTHALREEGDWTDGQYYAITAEFLPTPSARRATPACSFHVYSLPQFLPTPSARRATPRRRLPAAGPTISTHALREEGDFIQYTGQFPVSTFLPTPSARRATRKTSGWS